MGAQEQVRITLRLPLRSHALLLERSRISGRSMNAEIVARLDSAGEADDGRVNLREWYAGQILPALISAVCACTHNPAVREGETIQDAIARDTFRVADAMLRARAKNQAEGE